MDLQIMDFASLLVIALIIIFCGSVYFIKSRNLLLKPTKLHGVLITGCDSGIGYSLALFCQKLGFTVFAGCLNIDGAGPSVLKQMNGIIVLKLDVTDISSIENCRDEIQNYLNIHSDIKLKTIVNNAGVMMFGEFHWLTKGFIQNQIEVNLLGAMYVTHIFRHFLFTDRGRIINISSHCAFEGLPGLSIYSATKAGLLSWTNSLRREFHQYGIDVVSFIPGSYFTETNILSKQLEYAEEMKNHMAPNDWFKFKEYFEDYNLYLSYISAPSEPTEIQSKILYKNFNDALLRKYPKYVYCYSPWRYNLYHFLFRLTPNNIIRDKLVIKFMKMPRWNHYK